MFVKRQITKTPVDYEHSSAKYYITGKLGIYQVLNYCELADINLTVPLEKNAEPIIIGSTLHTLPGSETAAEKR